MNMGDMDHGKMMEYDISSYDIYTINGKTYEENEPLEVKKGEKVKFRFVNAGYMAHQNRIPIEYKVTHLDGQKINNSQVEQASVFEIAPGERYDIEFVADGKGSLEEKKTMISTPRENRPFHISFITELNLHNRKVWIHPYQTRALQASILPPLLNRVQGFREDPPQLNRI